MGTAALLAALPSRRTGAAPAVGQELTALNIRLTFHGKAVAAMLLENATARDFLSLLPLTLTLEGYASSEKISYLPRKLSTAGAPAGIDPAPGDIAYYAPSVWRSSTRTPFMPRVLEARPRRFRHGGAEREGLVQGDDRGAGQ